jgi:AcrR family transcriptional regulator
MLRMSSAAASDRRALRGQATRDRIIDAAKAVLIEEGQASTSTRAVADRAGVRLSLVHYHFGGKQGLLVEVLERETSQLLERQRELYAAPGPLSEKWRIACDLLDEDVRSGYVRLLWELWSAGLADPELAAGWRAAIAGWRDLLTDVFATWAEELDVEPPLSPRALASFTATLFHGIEIEMLAGVTETESPHREVLDAVGALIAQAEGVSPSPRRP